MANTDLIKKLRENTGCGMSDCNKALKENNDDYEKAVEWLRKKGLSSAAKKSARVTSEGIVGVENEGNRATIIEVNSETDFVARNEQFQSFVKKCLVTGLEINEQDPNKFVELLKDTYCIPCGQKISDDLTQNIATIGENLQIRRGVTLYIGEGLIASYIHNAIKPGLGKIGVLVSLQSSSSKDKLEELGKGIAMHIAATKPEFLKESDVPSNKVDSEKEIARELAKKSGKPDNVIEKMIEGRIKKFYEENVLLNQMYIMDNTKKISDILKDFEKETGKTVEIKEFVLFVLGEGIEKQSADFAEEVASMVK
ncbi:MAG TPA: translation elongation factor Ts [Rickettsiales bacterium]|nr:translation elongation factor Ts [Rickettsiales bacterium]